LQIYWCIWLIDLDALLLKIDNRLVSHSQLGNGSVCLRRGFSLGYARRRQSPKHIWKSQNMVCPPIAFLLTLTVKKDFDWDAFFLRIRHTTEHQRQHLKKAFFLPSWKSCEPDSLFAPSIHKTRDHDHSCTMLYLW
jgi:hypothetical protein